MPGYPIRTPWDQRSVDNSPRPIAASHVLHRLLVPRHPPFALHNLTTKMLASTMHISNNNQTPTTPPPHTPTPKHKDPNRSTPEEQFGGQVGPGARNNNQPHRGIPETRGHNLPRGEGAGCSFRTQQDVFLF